MNRQFLAGVLAIIVATVCISVPECSAWAPPLVIDSDWELYTPVGTTVEIHAWVVSGGPVDTWVWSWGSGVMDGEPSSSGDSSTSRGHFNSPGRYSVWVSAYGEGGSDDARTYVWNVDVVIDTPSSFPAYVALGQSLALGCTPLGATGGSFGWSKVSGPGNVTFAPSIGTEDPSFSANLAGDYTVQVLYSRGATVSDTSGTIKVVEVNDVISSKTVACIGENVTFGALTYPPNCAPYVTITWSGGQTPPTGSGSQFTTNWSTPGPKAVIATCGSSSAQKSITVVKVDKLQYWDGISSLWIDAGASLYIAKGDSVTFKAIPDPCTASWPSGKPVWGGSSGASGTGTTKAVTFSTLSTSTSDYKTVTAECGNTVTVNTIVYDFDGTFLPSDNFTRRSLTDYGIEETVALGCTITLGLTASQIGGLEWSEELGKGILSGVTNNGTADYDADAYPGTANLYLKIQSGPSREFFKNWVRNLIAPSGINFVQKPGTIVAHDYGVSSAGFLGEFYLRPTNVSFINLSYGEATCSATLNGWYSSRFPTGAPHSANGPFAIGGGHITNGSKVEGEDEVFDWASSPPNFSSGYLIWPIPERYLEDTGRWVEFTTATHRGDIDSAGKKTIQKAGVGPFPKNLNDPTSGYYP